MLPVLLLPNVVSKFSVRHLLLTGNQIIPISLIAATRHLIMSASPRAEFGHIDLSRLFYPTCTGLQSHLIHHAEESFKRRQWLYLYPIFNGNELVQSFPTIPISAGASIPVGSKPCCHHPPPTLSTLTTTWVFADRVTLEVTSNRPRVSHLLLSTETPSTPAAAELLRRRQRPYLMS